LNAGFFGKGEETWLSSLSVTPGERGKLNLQSIGGEGRLYTIPPGHRSIFGVISDKLHLPHVIAFQRFTMA